ncbi:hypothetical protein E2C01_062362 [Portunus trituberculatus]|uniref:Helix-turn-helix domain-containing protein n=1 Tax=Portunus trituberculatus TaxID=210409 RepID=A0A5B7HEX3_PORTR|nr:hypothetical protein [Portunus trituberculatus]
MPEKYCRSVINAFVKQAFTHCSLWSTVSRELTIVSKMLTNNGYSKAEIDEVRTSSLVLKNNCHPLTATLQEDVDKIFQGPFCEDLKKMKFDPILPTDLRDKRTVILFNIDEYIISRSGKEIEEELLEENTWINEGHCEEGHISGIASFPYEHPCP